MQPSASWSNYFLRTFLSTPQTPAATAAGTHQARALMQQWHYWCFILLYYNSMGTISGKKVKIHNVSIPHYTPRASPRHCFAPAEMAPMKPHSAPLSPPLLFTCPWGHLHCNTPAQQKCPWVLLLCSGRKRGEKHPGAIAVLRVLVSQKNCIFPTYIIFSLW